MLVGALAFSLPTSKYPTVPVQPLQVEHAWGQRTMPRLVHPQHAVHALHNAAGWLYRAATPPLGDTTRASWDRASGTSPAAPSGLHARHRRPAPRRISPAVAGAATTGAPRPHAVPGGPGCSPTRRAS